MKVAIYLADYAQADQAGKVNAIGFGWTTIASPLGPFAVVVLIDFEWTESNVPHDVQCELLNEDGAPVITPGPLGPQPVQFGARVETGRPPGAIHGTGQRTPLAINIGAGMALDPGRYEWRVTVTGNGSTVETATAPFLVWRPDQVQGMG